MKAMKAFALPCRQLSAEKHIKAGLNIAYIKTPHNRNIYPVISVMAHHHQAHFFVPHRHRAAGTYTRGFPSVTPHRYVRSSPEIPQSTHHHNESQREEGSHHIKSHPQGLGNQYRNYEPVLQLFARCSTQSEYRARELRFATWIYPRGGCVASYITYRPRLSPSFSLALVLPHDNYIGNYSTGFGHPELANPKYRLKTTRTMTDVRISPDGFSSLQGKVVVMTGVFKCNGLG